MVMSSGGATIFLQRPMTLSLLLVSLALIILVARRSLKTKGDTT
jgi:TctA family transporter